MPDTLSAGRTYPKAADSTLVPARRARGKSLYVRWSITSALACLLTALVACGGPTEPAANQDAPPAPLDSYQEAPSSAAGRCIASPGGDRTPESYTPGAKERSSTGKGMRVTGTVRSSYDCSPIPYARVELWHETPNGGYDDRYRSVIKADGNGKFSYTGPALMESTEGRPHVHFLARAEGFATGVVTVEPSSGTPQKIDVLIVLNADPEVGDVAL